MSKGERIAVLATLGVAALISAPWFYFQLRIWKAEGHDYMLTAANVIVTVLLWAVLAGAICYAFARKREKAAISSPLASYAPIPVSKLVIHSALYRPTNKFDPDGTALVKDVTETLQHLAHDALAMKIENDLLGAAGFAPGKFKQLQVTYSYDNATPVSIVRYEHDLMVLPEDSRLKEQANKPPDPCVGLLTPLQIDALRMAKELQEWVQGFIAQNGEEPCVDASLQNGTVEEATRDLADYAQRIDSWKTKLRSEYVLNFQAESITLYHRFVGEEIADRHLGTLVDTTNSKKDVLDLISTLRQDVFRSWGD